MHILHTADWHLGKTLMEKSLLEDQRHFLIQLKNILTDACKTENPFDALIIAGDIYDRAVPPSEAVKLFSDFLTQLNYELPQLSIIFSSGNHDSPERLEFMSSIVNKMNIYIASNCKNFDKGIEVKDFKTKNITGIVYNLPYLTPGCIEAENADGNLFEEKLRSQQELLEEAVRKIKINHDKNYKNLPAVCSAHLFTNKSITMSTKTSIGTAEAVSSELFDFFDYTALGHLHSFFKAAESECYYSGSPLSYTFDEKDNTKYFLDVNIDENKKVCVKKIEVIPLHRCIIIKDNLKNITSKSEYEKYKNDYVSIVCTDSTPVINPLSLLRNQFPQILQFTYQKTDGKEESSDYERKKNAITNASKEPEELLKTFLEDVKSNTEKNTELLEEEYSIFKNEIKSILNKEED